MNLNHIGPGRPVKRIPGLFSFFLLSILFLHSCREPKLGSDVRDQGDAVEVFFTDSLTIQSRLQREDSLRTDETSNNLLGTYIDPLLGQISASFYTQFRLPLNNINLGEGFEVDSVVLVMPYRDVYGDISKLNGRQRFSVYRVREDISLPSVYYSNNSFNVDPVPLGQTGFIVPRVLDSVLVNGNFVSPQLRIRLDNALGVEFSTNQQALANSEVFTEFFKGLYVRSDLPTSAPGSGAIVGFTLSGNTRLDLFYKNNTADSLSLSFIINENSARVGRFNHNYSELVQNMLSQPILGQEFSFVQSLAGLRTRIDFPDLFSWKGNRRVLINRASLIIPVDESSIGKYFPIARIALATADEAGNLVTTADLAVGESYAGGAYNAEKKAYIFNIARHLQRLMDGTIEDRGLFLVSIGSAISPNRVKVFGGTGTNGQRMKLELLYQNLPQ
jgi:hypothetical protein